jgi:hypothetical protein
MASQEIHNDVLQSVARNVAAITTNTTSAGNIIDMRGYDALEFVVFTGAYTDGTYTPLIEESDASDMSGSNAVADADLVGTDITSGQEAAAALAAANTAKRIGYVGDKRYVRLSFVSTSVSSGATVGAIALRGKPRVAPVAA